MFPFLAIIRLRPFAGFRELHIQYDKRTEIHSMSDIAVDVVLCLLLDILLDIGIKRY